MRFISGHQNLKYTVIPSRYVVDGGIKMTTPGLRATFENGVFDSDAAQRIYRWTDEQRVMVEKYLMEHIDFNRQNGYFLVDAEDPASLVTAAPSSDEEGCAFTFLVDGSAERCGQSTTGGLYCTTHAALLSKQPSAEVVG